jgi:glutathione synthase/RimK-type ligase-like ATP-grasp enzyme
MQTFDLTLLTYDKDPGLTADDTIFYEALNRYGLNVRIASWSDPGVNWADSKTSMFRSTWDYFHRTIEFRAWLDRVERSTRLVNDVELVRWNMHKSYLLDLEAKGISITPTVFVNAKGTVDLMEVCRSRGWTQIVVKPCIAGSAFGARRFALSHQEAEAQAYCENLLRNNDLMIQPYLSAVETDRERSLVFIDGEFSHAALKAAFSAGPAGGESLELEYRPGDVEIEAGRRIVEALPKEALYARVDLVPQSDGFLVMEVELIEPVLFFRFNPSSANRLVDRMIERRLFG